MLQTKSRNMECRMNEINFMISLAWAEGGRGVGDSMLKEEKCCEGVRALPTPEDSKDKFRSFDGITWNYIDSACKL